MLYAFALPGFQTFSYAAQVTFVMGGLWDKPPGRNARCWVPHTSSTL